MTAPERRERRQLTERAEPSREDRMVTLRRGSDGTPSVWCDPEIADLVQALNAGGVPTVASCSGHAHRPGVIALADGRELFIAKDFDEAREFDRRWPIDINGDVMDSSRPSARAISNRRGHRQA